MDAPHTLESEGMALYKQALATGDDRAVVQFVERALALPGSAAARTALEKLFRAERARLVKLKTLGLTGDFEARIGLTDRLITLTRKEPA